MKETVKSVIQILGCDRGEYAVIIPDGENVVSIGLNIGYSRDDFFKNVDTTRPRQPYRIPPALQKYLEEARKLFCTTGVRQTTEKVNTIITLLNLYQTSG